MPLRQSFEAAAGSVRGAVTGAQPTVVLMQYVIPVGTIVNDTVEIGAIPHGCFVIDAAVYQEAIGVGCTIDVGVMSGQYGKLDQARTMGNEIYAALAVATAGTSGRPVKNLMAIAPSASALGVGVRFLGAAPTAGKLLTIALKCQSK
jgi:hypothetical protein